MNMYHKINSLYKRDPSGKKMIFGDYSQPEFEYLKNNDWIMTEKVDGTNIRVMYDGLTLAFGGKSDNAQIPALLVNKLRELFTVEMFHSVFSKPDAEECLTENSVCLYGEGYGPKIQNGGKYKSEADFVLFDIKIGDWWLKREDVEGIADTLGIQVVPIIYVGPLVRMEILCQTGFDSQWGDFIAEGIVARPKIELKDRAGHRIIVKLKYKDYK